MVIYYCEVPKGIRALGGHPSMGHRRMLVRRVGLAIVLCLAASGRKIEQPILVVVQPEAESLGSVKASITNHSPHK